MFKLLRVVASFVLLLCLSQGTSTYGGQLKPEASELRILCWEGYTDPDYVLPFEKMISEKYGVPFKLKIKYVSDPNDFYELIRGKEIDMISPAHNIPKSLKWKFLRTTGEKLVLPLNLENIPNYKNLIPALQRPDYITQDGEVYGAAYTFGPYGMAYNSAVMKEEPKDYGVFFDPQWQARYTLSMDYHEANIYLVGLKLGKGRKAIFDYDQMNTREVRDELRRLAKGAASFWKGVDTAADFKGMAFATSWGFAIPDLVKAGEPWKMANPREGTTGWVDNWVIGWSLKNKPVLKEIAELWINHALSAEVQLGILRKIGSFPVITNLKSLATAAEVERFHLTDPNYFKENLILWEVLDERTQNGFRAMWDEAKK